MWLHVGFNLWWGLNRDDILEDSLTLIAGYNLSELAAAVNKTSSIPPLMMNQLLQVIYHCDDIRGNIIGNSFCINGCLPAQSLTEDDECQIAGNGTCPPPSNTSTITSTVTVTTCTTSSFCITLCQTMCFRSYHLDLMDPMTAIATPTQF